MKRANLAAEVMPAAVVLLLLLLTVSAGCGGGGEPLILAATSDLEGSSVLQAWAEDFRSRTGRQVELVVVPDEQAFAMVRHGECDIVLTHLYEEEQYMVRTGFIDEWLEVMRDDYVLAGPREDPAGVRDMRSAIDAMGKIADEGWAYVLRDDGSGAAGMQQYLLDVAGVEEEGEWMLITEGDAGEALRTASLDGAYVLTARSDFLRLAGQLELEISLEGDELLENPYRVAKVSALVYPDTDTAGAGEFISYLLSEDARSFFVLGAWVPPPAPPE